MEIHQEDDSNFYTLKIQGHPNQLYYGLPQVLVPLFSLDNQYISNIHRIRYCSTKDVKIDFHLLSFDRNNKNLLHFLRFHLRHFYF